MRCYKYICKYICRYRQRQTSRHGHTRMYLFHAVYPAALTGYLHGKLRPWSCPLDPAKVRGSCCLPEIFHQIPCIRSFESYRSRCDVAGIRSLGISRALDLPALVLKPSPKPGLKTYSSSDNRAGFTMLLTAQVRRASLHVVSKCLIC